MSFAKYWLAAAALLLCLASSAILLYQGHPIYALSTSLFAVLAGYAILRGLLESFRDPMCRGAFGLITLVSIAGVIAESDFFNANLQEAYRSAVLDLQSLSERCPPTTPEAYRLGTEGAAACAAQAYADQASATVDLAKARYLGPVDSLISSVTAMPTKATTRRCATIVKEALRICPYGLPSLNDDEKKAIFAAAEKESR
ncbi:hypothetical protein NX774_12150 [Massilia agilis]|uniref:Uncharacterized protein n=1 Tax=Massilia agilis TaxID=1811226 RepID=A0ABT2DBM0_9BURK|nr:hypothetical protein [Massilia agilis]MCS0808672.1 hypothetical protein [Massilia agilis]